MIYRSFSKVALVSTSAALISLSQANTVLFSDNFDTADTANLDLSPQAGRITGEPLQVRSAKIQHQIAGNQLTMIRASSAITGRIRFHDNTDNDPATPGLWQDWAGSATGADILAGGGVRVEFDWTTPIAPGNANQWIAVNAGHVEAATEPNFRITDPGTDAAFLFRQNGGTQAFNNGAGTAAGTFAVGTPLPFTYHVVVEYAFSSFADGTTVSMTAKVDGNTLHTGTYDWAANSGVMFLEVETNSQDRFLVDNLTISTLNPVPEPSVTAFLLPIGALLLRRSRRAAR
jgi:hypothetical protein